MNETEVFSRLLPVLESYRTSGIDGTVVDYHSPNGLAKILDLKRPERAGDWKAMRAKYMAGLEQADSFTCDFHKMLGASLMCKILLITNPDAKKSDVDNFFGRVKDVGPRFLEQ